MTASASGPDPLAAAAAAAMDGGVMNGGAEDGAAWLAVRRDGYTDLPPGLLANVVTYLEMTAPPAASDDPSPDAAAPATADPTAADPNSTDLTAAAPAGLTLRRLGADVALYRTLYRAIGENLLWVGRAGLADAALAAILADPRVEVLVAFAGDRPIGLAELDRRAEDGAVELVYFGLVPDHVGAGAGRWLMARAIAAAFARPATRLWLHTCTFDHPRALAFYRRAGFRPYKYALELLPDPRLSGMLPRTAAPQIPLIPPSEPAA
jgi:GNAT superfamily N-acetyltransferase